MTAGRISALVGVALLVMVANVASSVLYMMVYSYLINPGHDEQYYREHVKAAAPYCSIVAGIPLMFLAGLWVGSWSGGALGAKAALTVWLAYVVIDFSVLLATGLTVRIAALFVVSMLTKLGAAWLGAFVAGRV